VKEALLITRYVPRGIHHNLKQKPISIPIKIKNKKPSCIHPSITFFKTSNIFSLSSMSSTFFDHAPGLLGGEEQPMKPIVC
jgi:hypothetical protein